ncbi:MAG: hypothetical protein PHI11_14390 [Gallionella sp.]|nr:hypothetical protein [Gallionella sp.]
MPEQTKFAAWADYREGKPKECDDTNPCPEKFGRPRKTLNYECLVKRHEKKRTSNCQDAESEPELPTL